MIYLYLAGLVASFVAGFFVAKNNYSTIKAVEAKVDAVAATTEAAVAEVKTETK